MFFVYYFLFNQKLKDDTPFNFKVWTYWKRGVMKDEIAFKQKIVFLVITSIAFLCSTSPLRKVIVLLKTLNFTFDLGFWKRGLSSAFLKMLITDKTFLDNYRFLVT